MNCTGKQITMVALIAFSLILLVQNVTMASGSIKMWSAIYEHGQHHKALFHMMDCADSYKVPGDDFALLPIVKDALGRGEKVAQLAVQVFRFYNHLWGAREEEEYAEVLKAVSGKSDYKELDKYDFWYFISACNGANMRDEPSLDGNILTAVKYGMQVLVSQKEGKWLHVMPTGPGSIDPRFENKKGYIHHSLLHPY